MNDYEFLLNTALDLFDKVRIYPKSNATWTTRRYADIPTYNQVNMPAVKSVIFNKNATIVYFNDGTKCIVHKSAQDEYNREHAVVYAIVKRAYGTVDENGVVQGNGMGAMLARVVENGYDQDARQEKQNSNKSEESEEDSLCSVCDIADCEDRNAPFKGTPRNSKDMPRDSKGRFVKKANR